MHRSSAITRRQALLALTALVAASVSGCSLTTPLDATLPPTPSPALPPVPWRHAATHARRHAARARQHPGCDGDDSGGNPCDATDAHSHRHPPHLAARVRRRYRDGHGDLRHERGSVRHRDCGGNRVNSIFPAIPTGSAVTVAPGTTASRA